MAALPSHVLRAARAFGLDPESLRSLGGASGATWSDGRVVLRIGRSVAAEVSAASAAAARVPVPRVLEQGDGAVLLELVRGQPAGELALTHPERAQAAGRACGALHERLAGIAAPATLPDADPSSPARGLLHLDLHPYNVLVDDDGEPTAVIDWTNAASGDPLLDRARTWSILTLDPAARALQARDGWRALTQAWLDALRDIPAAARAWACRYMLDDLRDRHPPAALAHVRETLGHLTGD